MSPSHVADHHQVLEEQGHAGISDQAHHHFFHHALKVGASPSGGPNPEEEKEERERSISCQEKEEKEKGRHAEDYH